jgi:hypothetical protein
MTTPAPDDTRALALVDLLDRLLAGGVVITGDVTIGIADVDLVRISLRALIMSVDAMGEALSEYASATRDER